MVMIQTYDADIFIPQYSIWNPTDTKNEQFFSKY